MRTSARWGISGLMLLLAGLPWLASSGLAQAQQQARDRILCKVAKREPATVLLTIEGNHVRIPNSTVYKGVIVNYTRNLLRRFDLAAGIGVDGDIAAAQHLGIEVLQATPGVLADPPPQALVEDLGESNVVIRYLAWVDQRASDFLAVKSEAIRRGKEALDAAGITLPSRPTGSDKGRPEAPAPAVEQRERPPADVARRHVVERQADAERAAEGPDLLDPAAPREL